VEHDLRQQLHIGYGQIEAQRRSRDRERVVAEHIPAKKKPSLRANLMSETNLVLFFDDVVCYCVLCLGWRCRCLYLCSWWRCVCVCLSLPLSCVRFFNFSSVLLSLSASRSVNPNLALTLTLTHTHAQSHTITNNNNKSSQLKIREVG
jgi:hypothetical protein